MAITILDVALDKGAMKDKEGNINATEFDRLGLPFFSGCQDCHASLGPFNAFPSKTGWVKCRDCIEDSNLGFETIIEFDKWCEQQVELEDAE